MNPLTRIVACLAFSSITNLTLSQPFTPTTIGELPTGFESITLWVDVDNDGDSDLIYSTYGMPVSLYKNDGGTYTFYSNWNLPSLLHPLMGAADFNKDGFADLVLGGVISGGDQMSVLGGGIYLNDGTGSFSKSEEANIPVLSKGNVDCADFDLDGDVDILMVGSDHTVVAKTLILVNNGDGSFSQLPHQLPGVRSLYGAKGSWGDFDRDGDADILLSGDNFDKNESTPITRIFVNNGDRTFSSTAFSFTEHNGKSEWVDVNLDGWLDVFVSGYHMSSSNTFSKIYLNTNGSFADGPSFVSEIPFEDFIWSDFDNDGDKDMLGYQTLNNDIFLYLNEAGSLTKSGISFPAHSHISSSDFDGDGDADILLVGYKTGFTPSIEAYTNNSTMANARPAAPTNMVATPFQGTVTFNWTASTDEENAVNTLTYVLRVGTSPGASDVISPLTTLAAYNLGDKSIVGHLVTNIIISDLPSDTYYATVQAIDQNGNVSLPSNTVVFTINNPPHLPRSPDGLVLQITPTNFVSLSWVDRSSNEDLFIIEQSDDGVLFEQLITVSSNVMHYVDRSVEANHGYHYRVRSQNGEGSSDYTAVESIHNPIGTFTKLEGFTLPSTESNQSVSVDWIDYNNDDYDDLFMASSGGENLLYKNNTDGSFERITGGELVAGGVQNRRSCWADYDNDGDLDVFIPTSFKGRLFNNNNGVFSEVIGAPFDAATSDTYGVSWVDYDNDGFLDLSVLYYYSPSNLFHNNGDGTFSKVTEGVLVEDTGSFASIAWCDYNSDGWQDALAVNYEGDLTLYKNKGGKEFERVSTDLTSSFSSAVSASWGDYDNDGDFDVFIGHNTNISDAFFRNNGDGTFTRIFNEITSANMQAFSSSWGDIDNDGNIDLFVVTDNEKGIFFNNGDGSFQRNSPEPSLSDAGYTQGVALSDFNKDGFLDAAIPTVYLDNVVLKNNGNENHWISFKLRGTKTNRNAIGARVTVTTGSKRMTSFVASQTGHSSANSFDIEFGLGTRTTVDSVVVEWPRHGFQILTNTAADQFLEIVEPSFPDAPLASVSSVGKEYLRVEWSEIPEATYYVIERSIGSRFAFQRIRVEGGTRLSLVDEMPVELDSVFYRVVAISADDNASIYSNVAAAFCSMRTPKILHPAMQGNHVNLSWEDHSTVEDGYRVYRSTDNVGFQEIVTTEADVSGYEDRDFVEQETNFYTIKAVSGSYVSDFTDTLSVVTGLRGPSNVSFTLQEGAIEIRWTDNSEKESSYSIERSDGNAQSFGQIGTAEANSMSFLDEQFPIGMQSYYRVRALNAAGASDYVQTEPLLLTPVELAEHGDIQVYPNPATAFVNVRTRAEDKQVDVINSVGARVWSTSSSSEITTVDLRELPEGIYLISVVSRNATFMRRIIVVR